MSSFRNLQSVSYTWYYWSGIYYLQQYLKTFHEITMLLTRGVVVIDLAAMLNKSKSVWLEGLITLQNIKVSLAGRIDHSAKYHFQLYYYYFISREITSIYPTIPHHAGSSECLLTNPLLLLVIYKFVICSLFYTAYRCTNFYFVTPVAILYHFIQLVRVVTRDQHDEISDSSYWSYSRDIPSNFVTQAHDVSKKKNSQKF